MHSNSFQYPLTLFHGRTLRRRHQTVCLLQQGLAKLCLGRTRARPPDRLPVTARPSQALPRRHIRTTCLLQQGLAKLCLAYARIQHKHNQVNITYNSGAIYSTAHKPRMQTTHSAQQLTTSSPLEGRSQTLPLSSDKAAEGLLWLAVPGQET